MLYAILKRCIILLYLAISTFNNLRGFYAVYNLQCLCQCGGVRATLFLFWLDEYILLSEVLTYIYI